MISVTHWMAWEGGVDLAATTRENLSQPNVILQVANMVHTPAGSAPCGVVFFQPEPDNQPLVYGFISTKPSLGTYFGKAIFAGTPFEHAPSLQASIEISHPDEFSAHATIGVAGHTFEIKLSNLGSLQLVNREPQSFAPFFQNATERQAGQVSLKVNGSPLSLIIPPIGPSGGPAAISTPCGIYAR